MGVSSEFELAAIAYNTYQEERHIPDYPVFADLDVADQNVWRAVAHAVVLEQNRRRKEG